MTKQEYTNEGGASAPYSASSAKDLTDAVSDGQKKGFSKILSGKSKYFIFAVLAVVIAAIVFCIVFAISSSSDNSGKNDKNGNDTSTSKPTKDDLENVDPLETEEAQQNAISKFETEIAESSDDDEKNANKLEYAFYLQSIAKNQEAADMLGQLDVNSLSDDDKLTYYETYYWIYKNSDETKANEYLELLNTELERQAGLAPAE